MLQNYPDSKRKDSISAGLEFQDFVIVECYKIGIILMNFSSKKYQYNKGEGLSPYEIKLDEWCSKTYRLSIEFAERTAINKPWVKSGIDIENNSIFYIQGNHDIFFCFTKKMLRKLHNLRKKDGSKKFEDKEEDTIKTFYLPFKYCKEYCAFYIDPKDGSIHTNSLPFNEEMPLFAQK